jgi:RNA polymerase sigma factor for flagellar operon FliA
MSQNDASTRDQLIRDHSSAARRIALRVARRCPDWVHRDDLVSAGMVGLIEAADRYDATRREPFLAFAEHRIRGAILDELRRGDILPRRRRQLARRVATAIRELEEDGESLSDQRIAEKLGISLEEYRAELAQLVNMGTPLDIEQQNLTTNEVAPDVQAGRRETLDRIRAELERLDSRDAKILGMHYLEDLTYQEIAATLEITPSRVCQLMARATERLRALLGMNLVEAW